MQEVLDFLNECKAFYLATTEADQPRVRPLGFAMAYEGKLCFCTSNQKPMYRQMKANPKVEVCGCNAEGRWVRVAGRAGFITTEASQKKALEVMPSLGNIYSVGDGKFEIFALEGAVATFAAMGSGESKTVEL